MVGHTPETSEGRRLAHVELRLLGSVRLQAPDGRDIGILARQAKRTALLAYLAAALPRGPQRRDTLLALFWPESDTTRARAALNQALYVLRAALGDEAIVPLGDGAVGVNGEAVWCDVVAFETALDAGRPREALALYRGDLLEGFFVAGAPEFEHWLERERNRLRERASEGSWAVAEERAAAGDTLEAERWARRAAALLPADEAVARRLMAFLHRLGDRAAATRAYEEFALRLEREYELEPSAQTQALATAIREAQEHVPPAPAVKPAKRESAGAALRAPAARARVAAALTVVLVGLLAGAWVLVRTLDARRADRAPKRLVVLPFANLGRPEDEYFADGITDEIAARLAAIHRLRIIGRASAGRYKQTDKTLTEIGSELGVSYVLEGSVRWEKPPQGPARVRVTPRLVRVADGAHLWAEVYDEPLDGIFRVQSDIARKVVRALDVTLLDRQRRTVDAIPTRSLEAYDFYLRGNDYMTRGLEARHALAAVQMYEKAVELDPRFALAYARLARIHSRMYWLYYDRSEDRLARAKRAVDRALELAPDLPHVHLALGAYLWMCYLDYDRALREFAIADAGLPNEPDVLIPRAVLRMRQGDFGRGFQDYAKALQLDPGSASIAANYAAASDFHRAYARAESLFDRAIALSPDRNEPYFEKAGVYLRWEGSTQKARAVLEQVQAIGVTDAPILLLHQVRVDVLDRRYQAALGHLSSGFPEVISWHFRFIPRAQLYADVYALMQRHDLARAYYDSARVTVHNRLQSQPDDPRLHRALGIAYAGLGRTREAIEEGRKGVELLPISKEAERGYYGEWDLARIYTMVGEHDAALDRLEYLLSIPGELTPAWLHIDPTWDPLRGHTKFQKLLNRKPRGEIRASRRAFGRFPPADGRITRSYREIENRKTRADDALRSDGPSFRA
jgi:TolB-like protein/DNA-binding SARP family transcriptional activator/Flp pilus assembly protein TadD